MIKQLLIILFKNNFINWIGSNAFYVDVKFLSFPSFLASLEYFIFAQ